MGGYQILSIPVPVPPKSVLSYCTDYYSAYFEKNNEILIANQCIKVVSQVNCSFFFKLIRA